ADESGIAGNLLDPLLRVYREKGLHTAEGAHGSARDYLSSDRGRTGDPSPPALNRFAPLQAEAKEQGRGADRTRRFAWQNYTSNCCSACLSLRSPMTTRRNSSGFSKRAASAFT